MVLFIYFTISRYKLVWYSDTTWHHGVDWPVCVDLELLTFGDSQSYLIHTILGIFDLYFTDFYRSDKKVPVLKKKKVAILKRFGQVKLFAT